MSQTFSKKKLQVANSTLVNFFEMKKISFQKKNTSVGSKHQSNPKLVFFFEKVWDIAKFRKYQGKND